MDLVEWVLAALRLSLSLALPMLLAALVVGGLVAFFQAATQAQDASIGFVPKLCAVGLAIFLSAGSASQQLQQFATRVFSSIAEVAR